MSKILLFGAIISIFATNAFAVSSTVTSKDYVDDLVATKQVKIPAAGATGVGAGETIITYTGAAGTIGERGIYSDASSYDATTDADKIITASALNGAVSNISTTETSKLTCYDNDCTLWNIGTQTAYGVNAADTAILEMLSALVNTNGTSYCYNSLSGTIRRTCANGLTTTGSWGAMFTYNNQQVQINGIGACSALAGSTMGEVASNQAMVQGDYESNIRAGYGASPVGVNCYCKLIDPSISAARWIFLFKSSAPWESEPTSSSLSDCRDYCEQSCGDSIQNNSSFRAAVFGVN